jgi:general secretion pathway protein I
MAEPKRSSHRWIRPGWGAGFGGFTLIETLVAMMVLAISLTVIFQLFSGGLRSARVADDHTRAVFFAREKMEEILLQPALLPGVYTGRFNDRYRWRAELALVEGVAEPDEAEAVRPVGVSVEVIWKTDVREKRFSIQTVTLARLDNAANDT